MTVTDPSMTRFLMSLEDLVHLVLFAYQHARQGDILVQKAPACTVGMLAQALANIFKQTCRIKIIGTRHGEKLYTVTRLARRDGESGRPWPLLSYPGR